MNPIPRNLLRWTVGIFLLFITYLALAQVVTSSTAQPSPDELFTGAVNVYQDWTSAGVLAGIIALVKLAVDVTKLNVVDNWLWDHQWRWVRPIAALLLGGLLQLAAAIPMHANPYIAFVHGMLAGASSIGVNELATMMADRKKIKAVEESAPRTAV